MIRQAVGAVIGSLILTGPAAAGSCVESARAVDIVETTSQHEGPIPELSVTITSNGGPMLLTAAVSTRIQAHGIAAFPVGRVLLRRGDMAEPLASYTVGAVGVEFPANTGLREPVSFAYMDVSPPGESVYTISWFVGNPNVSFVAGNRSLQATAACD
jgi:hypothetical protein